MANKISVTSELTKRMAIYFQIMSCFLFVSYMQIILIHNSAFVILGEDK